MGAEWHTRLFAVGLSPFLSYFPNYIYLNPGYEHDHLYSDGHQLFSYQQSEVLRYGGEVHAHSTEIGECTLGPKKTPVNPVYLIMDFEIPAGSTEFVVNKEISLPLSDANGDFDLGDYHFFISLTDREGWSTQKGFNIKILKREEN